MKFTYLFIFILFLIPDATFANMCGTSCFPSYEYIVEVEKISHEELVDGSPEIVLPVNLTSIKQYKPKSKFIDGFVIEYEYCSCPNSEKISNVRKMTEADLTGQLSETLKNISEGGVYELKAGLWQPFSLLGNDSKINDETIPVNLNNETTIDNLYEEARNDFFVQEFKFYLNKILWAVIPLLLIVLLAKLFKPIFRNTIFTNTPKRQLWFYRIVFLIYFGWLVLFILVNFDWMTMILSYLQIKLIYLGMIFEILHPAFIVLLSLTLITLLYKSIRKLYSVFRH